MEIDSYYVIQNEDTKEYYFRSFHHGILWYSDIGSAECFGSIEQAEEAIETIKVEGYLTIKPIYKISEE